MSEYTSIEEQVEYAVQQIDPKRRVEISLRDLMFIHEVIGEFVRFFHQPLHYQSLKDVERFLGDIDSGGFHLLNEAYRKKLQDVWPEDIKQGFGDGIFDHPNPPYYYKPDSKD